MGIIKTRIVILMVTARLLHGSPSARGGKFTARLRLAAVYGVKASTEGNIKVHGKAHTEAAAKANVKATTKASAKSSTKAIVKANIKTRVKVSAKARAKTNWQVHGSPSARGGIDNT